MALFSPQAVLFDLDGTLLDTAPDLGYALNQLLINQNIQPLPIDKIRPYAGAGAKGLIKFGFAISETDPTFEGFSQQLLEIYSQCLTQKTHLFPSMNQILDYLEERKIKWGIVTNKPAWLTLPLLKHLNLSTRASCVVSGDTIAKRKPDPAPLLYACQQLGVSAAECIYIGDSEVDVIAGINAGMKTIVALYGYIPSSFVPKAWGATHMINDPKEILEIVK